MTTSFFKEDDQFAPRRRGANNSVYAIPSVMRGNEVPFQPFSTAGATLPMEERPWRGAIGLGPWPRRRKRNRGKK